MRSLIAALLLTLLSAGSSAQPADEEPVRLQIDLEGGLPVVAAVVDGRAMRLYLDLGGHLPIALRPAALKRLGPLASVGSGAPASYVDAFGMAHDAASFQITTLSIDGHDFAAAAGATLPSGPAAFDGYLGIGFFKDQLVVFDYPHGAVRLYRHDQPQALARECPAARFDIQISDDGVQSLLATAQGPLRALWDTGATANVIRSRAATAPARRFRWPWQADLLTLADATLGGKPTGPIVLHRLDFKQPDADLILGYDFFKTRTVCFDLAAGIAGIGS